MEEENIKVYVKTNTDGYITEVGSSIFIKDLTGWTLIDSGQGDRYAHAQSQYFDKPLQDEDGTYNYRLKDGKVYGD